MPWAPGYATVDELREYVRIDDTADDTVLTAAIEGASRAIDDACDPRPGRMRQFGRTDTVEDRYYTVMPRGYGPPFHGQWVTEVDDIADAAGLVVAVDPAGTGSYAPVTGASLLPRNAALLGLPYSMVCFAGSSAPVPSPLAEAVKVTATWGWAEVPIAIHQACLIEASRLVGRRDAPFGVSGSPEAGTEVRLAQVAAPRSRALDVMARLDTDAETLIKPFMVKLPAVLA